MHESAAFRCARADPVSTDFQEGNHEDKAPSNFRWSIRLITLLIEMSLDALLCSLREEQFLRNGPALGAG